MLSYSLKVHRHKAYDTKANYRWKNDLTHLFIYVKNRVKGKGVNPHFTKMRGKWGEKQKVNSLNWEILKPDNSVST